MPSYKLFETRTGNAPAAEGVTAEGTIYSARMTPSRWADLGFTLRWTGTPTGTFTLWYCDKDAPADADWVQDTGWAPTNPAGSASGQKYVLSGLKARWVRVRYVHASGTGKILGTQTA